MELAADNWHDFENRPALPQRPAAAAPKPPVAKPSPDKPAAEASPDKKADGDEVDAEKHLFGEDGFTFGDFLDIINPLQHIPIISTLYREITDDRIAALPRILGGTLFGGPIGAGAAVINSALHRGTGKDIGEHVVAFFTDESDTALARATPDANMETAAGTTAEKAAPTRVADAPLVAPTQAELDILKQEVAVRRAEKGAAQSLQAAQDDTAPPSGDPGETITAASPAEERILAMESAFSKLAQDLKRQGPKQTDTTAKPAPATVAENAPRPRAEMRFPQNAETPPENARPARSVLPERVHFPASWFPFNPSVAADNPTGESSVKSSINARNAARADAAGGGGVSRNAPLGATAADGGWFADTMMSALDKYEQVRKLDDPVAPKVLNQLN